MNRKMMLLLITLIAIQITYFLDTGYISFFQDSNLLRIAIYAIPSMVVYLFLASESIGRWIIKDRLLPRRKEDFNNLFKGGQ